LNLLPNLFAHMGAVRVELRQSADVRVDVSEIELRFAQRVDNLQDVKSPPAFLNIQLFEGAQPLVRTTNIGGSLWGPAFD
jgi:hypothetical protein